MFVFKISLTFNKFSEDVLLSFWFVLLSVFDKSVLFDSKGEQDNEASVHLCFTSCITSLEQEPCSYLDGK